MKTPPRWIRRGLAVWLFAVIAGTAFLIDHSNRAGESATPPVRLATKSAGYRLLMFAHPRCPCTVASLRELERVLARCSQAVDVTVYFFQPQSASEDWVHGASYHLASAIPGVAVVVDAGGVVAEQFGSKTSGDVQLYDAAGRLRFHGGITSARGHEGDGLGKAAVTSILRGESTAMAMSPVFGCSLRLRTMSGADAD